MRKLASIESRKPIPRAIKSKLCDLRKYYAQCERIFSSEE